MARSEVLVVKVEVACQQRRARAAESRLGEARRAPVLCPPRGSGDAAWLPGSEAPGEGAVGGRCCARDPFHTSKMAWNTPAAIRQAACGSPVGPLVCLARQLPSPLWSNYFRAGQPQPQRHGSPVLAPPQEKQLARRNSLCN